MSNLSCIGLAVANQEAMALLIERMIATAAVEASIAGRSRHLRWTDRSGASMAVHLDEQQRIECITPFFEAPAAARWRVRTSAPADDGSCGHCGGVDCDLLGDAGEMVTRSTVQLLLYQPYRAWLGEARQFALQAVLFAHRAACYATSDALAADQVSWWGRSDDPELRMAEESFLPIGMFGGGDDVGRRAQVLLSGRVQTVARLTNQLSGQAFVHVRLATLPGAVDVVSNDWEGAPVAGALAVVRGWLVGRPEPPVPAPHAPTARRSWWRRALGN